MSCTVWPVRLVRGEDARLLVTVEDDLTERVDLTGGTLRAGFATTAGAALAIDKSTPTGIELLAQTGDTLGQAEVVLLPADTSELAPGRYVGEVLLTLGTGERYVVARMELELLQEIVT